MRKAGWNALGEQDGVEVQQRIAQRHAPHDPAGLEEQFPAPVFRRPRGKLCNPLRHAFQFAHVVIDVRAQRPELVGQPPAAVDDPAGMAQQVPPGGAGAMSPGPLAEAALRGGPSQRDVLLRPGRIYLHFIEVEVAPAGQLQPDEPGPPAGQIDHKRPAVGVAPEVGAVVLVRLAHVAAVVAQQHTDAPVAGAGGIAAVVEDQPAECDRCAQVDLPPGVILDLGVEAPGAVDHAVDGAGGVSREGHRARRGAIGHAAQLALKQPVGLDLPRLHSRAGRQGRKTQPHRPRAHNNSQLHDELLAGRPLPALKFRPAARILPRAERPAPAAQGRRTKTRTRRAASPGQGGPRTSPGQGGPRAPPARAKRHHVHAPQGRRCFAPPGLAHETPSSHNQCI